MYLTRLRGLLSFTLFMAAASSAFGSISYTGAFNFDDDAQLITFNLAAPTNVTFLTLSYAGGVNAQGQIIPRGGFDPVLSLFTGSSDPNGLLIGLNNDGGCGNVGTDSVTGACWDSYFQALLPIGSYTLVLTQSDNSAVGPTLGDGFSRTGQGNFTGPTFLGSPGSFIDANPNQRNGNWAVDILNVAAPVPEPASIGFAALGLFVILSRRFSKNGPNL